MYIKIKNVTAGDQIIRKTIKRLSGYQALLVGNWMIETLLSIFFIKMLVKFRANSKNFQENSKNGSFRKIALI